MTKMCHARADGSKLHEASLRERRQSTLARFDAIRQTTAAPNEHASPGQQITSAGGAFNVIVASISAM